jgi:death-on-curing protein
VIYLSAADLLHIAERATGGPVDLRDAGLLESAAGRPATTAFGKDAYPTLCEKAAALLHSLARNHPLVDGNKRLALGATIAFLRVNGRRLTIDNDQAYDLIVAVASGALDEVAPIAAGLEAGSEPVG